jgi:hypothetical protein
MTGPFRPDESSLESLNVLSEARNALERLRRNFYRGGANLTDRLSAMSV